MAKKRKSSGRPYGQSEAQEVRDADAKVKPIQSYEDVADSEDEFHINRDKILLEESVDQKRQRRWREEGSLILVLWCRIRRCC
jgi:U3 small nucleolar RNA-associated protein 3